MLTLAYTSGRDGNLQRKKQLCQERKATKLKQEKMEPWWRKPVGLASSLDVFSDFREEGSKSDFEG